MAETDNPDAPVVAPRTARFGDGPEGRAARQERGQSGQPSRFGGIAQFIHDVRSELRRVTWPTFIHVRNSTIITIVAVIFFAVYLFLIDQGLARLILGIDWVIDRIIRFLGIG